MGVSVKTKAEIEVLREGGRRLAAVLDRIAQAVEVGVSTAELDILAERLILAKGGLAIFKGYKIREANTPYPASICTSINDEVVHGIPRRDRILKEGDVLGIDIGMRWPTNGNQESGIRNHGKGLCTDMAVTIGVGKIAAEAERLIRATEKALDVGIAVVRSGSTIGDIGHAIGAHLKKAGLGVIRDLAGHGVGYELHEEPLIPNYGTPGSGLRLREGMVLAIEPMATLGGERIILDDDEWTFRTADDSLAAHFEHTVAVTESGAEVLTMLLLRYLGVDYGRRRIGVALSDPEGKIAFPHRVIENRGSWQAADELRAIAAGEDAGGIILGLPLGLDGNETEESGRVRAFAETLQKESGLPIIFENEAFTTRMAGHRGVKKEKADAASAAIILQSYLDKKTG